MSSGKQKSALAVRQLAEMSIAHAAKGRDLYLDPKISEFDGRSPLPREGRSVKYGPDGPRIHAGKLKLGVNPGVLTVTIVTEPCTGGICTSVTTFCSSCDECPLPVLLEICHLDEVYDPLAISQRLATGRELRIHSPLYPGL